MNELLFAAQIHQPPERHTTPRRQYQWQGERISPQDHLITEREARLRQVNEARTGIDELTR